MLSLLHFVHYLSFEYIKTNQYIKTNNFLYYTFLSSLVLYKEL